MMFSRPRILIGLAVLAAALLSVGPSHGQAAKNKANTKNVTFKTADSVELGGTLYPAPSGKRDATVIMLHNFDLKKGGSSSSEEGWGQLAAALQNAGYVVLTFDFRGFGESKTLGNKMEFWNAKHNGLNYISRRGAKLPDSIDHKDFKSPYLPHFINDIAAAKAYVDKLNDNRECNASSVILIGAGDSATLGAMWMAHEFRRCRDTNKGMALVPAFSEPEGKDLAAGVWLTISPTLAGQRLYNVTRLVTEVGKANKVPMGFVFGKNDTKGEFSRNLEKAIKGITKTKEMSLTGIKPVPDTKLSGEKLLDKDTQKWVVDYLNTVMEARGARIRRDRKIDENAFWYVQGSSMRPTRLNKNPGNEVPSADPSVLQQ